MTFTNEQRAALEAPLDPKHVKKPSGSFGPKGDYLEGWHVINELNRVFGFDGWSYRIELSRDDLSRVEGKDQWAAAYTCICTLTVGDTMRQDVGFGSGFAKQIGDAIEGATKEAATDALKRCARTFGNIFGLALYDKSRANVQTPPEDLTSLHAMWAECVTLAQAANVTPLSIAKSYNLERFADIPADKLPAIKKKLNLLLDEQIQKKEAA